MAKKTKLNMFASLLRQNYYFKKENTSSFNKWKWYDKDHDTIVIWSTSPMTIMGLSSFLSCADLLDLCARVEYNPTERRLEIMVH